MKYLYTLLLSLILLFTNGCRTTQEGKKEVDIERVSRVAGLAAEIGAMTYIQKNPNSRPAFEVTVQSLLILENSQDFDPAKFTAALQSLPIKKLKGPEGTLYVTVALVAWEELNAQAISGKIDNSKWVKPVLVKVREGLSRALENTKPPVN